MASAIQRSRLMVLSLSIAVLAASTAMRAQVAGNQTAPKPDQRAIVTTIPLVVDLASGSPQTFRLDAGTYQITLMNAVPGRAYWLRIGPTVAMPIPALQIDSSLFKAKSVPSIETPPTKECAALEAARLVATATDEMSVRSHADSVRRALVSAGCTKEQLELVQQVLDATIPVFTDSAIVLVADSIRKVDVASRTGEIWEFELSAVGRGVWQTTYGFAFNPNHDEEYFVEASGTDQYTIKRKARDKGSLTFLPAVFWTWLSSAQAFTSLQHGPTLGFGVTAGAPGGRLGALAGYSVRFNQNVGAVFGVSVYQHRRLDGRYHEGQVLKESLDSEKLNKDSTRANLFLPLRCASRRTRGVVRAARAERKRAAPGRSRPAGSSFPVSPT